MGINVSVLLRCDGSADALRERAWSLDIGADFRDEWDRVCHVSNWLHGEDLPSSDSSPEARPFLGFSLEFYEGWVAADHSARLTVLGVPPDARALFDAVALLNTHFQASDSYVIGDGHPFRFALRHGETDGTGPGAMPGCDEVPSPEHLETFYDQTEFARFDEGVIGPDVPRPWPPTPDRTLRPAVVPGPVEPLPSEVVATLTHELIYETRRRQAKAARALAVHGPRAREAVPALVRALDKDRAEVRGLAVRALEAVGDPSARPALKRLAGSDPDPDVRAESGFAWAALATDPAAALAELLSWDGFAERSDEILGYLAALGPSARSSASHVRPLIASHPSADLRARAAHTLWKIGIDPDSLPELRRGVRLPGLAGKWSARALVTLGEQAGAAVPDLIEAGTDPLPDFDPHFHEWVDLQSRRRAIAWALGAIGLETSLPLIELLGDADPSRRAGAADLLGWMRVPGTAGELSPLLDDPSVSVRWAAMRSLVRLGAGEPHLVAFLKAVLDGGDPDGGQSEAAWSLGILGPAAADALPLLERVAAAPNGPHYPHYLPRVRRWADWARARVSRPSRATPRCGSSGS